MALLLVGISFFAYKGVLDDHANSSSIKGEALAGGLSLDLLGLTMLVQFGSFASDYFYWLLGLIPIVGVYKLYKTFKGGKETISGFMPNPVESCNNNDDEDTAAKRQKRAERRRQKRH